MLQKRNNLKLELIFSIGSFKITQKPSILVLSRSNARNIVLAFVDQSFLEKRVIVERVSLKRELHVLLPVTVVVVVKKSCLFISYIFTQSYVLEQSPESPFGLDQKDDCLNTLHKFNVVFKFGWILKRVIGFQAYLFLP